MYRNLILGVKIQNVNIQNGETSKTSLLEITGNAKNALNLTLNGNEISINQAGDFSETIALSVGYNIVTIEARDKFGKSDKKIYQLIYAPENTEPQVENQNAQEKN